MWIILRHIEKTASRHTPPICKIGSVSLFFHIEMGQYALTSRLPKGVPGVVSIEFTSFAQ